MVLLILKLKAMNKNTIKLRPMNPTNPTSYGSEISNNENRIFNTKTLPLSIYENLPPILKESTDLFSDSIEKDVFLIGSLGVLSACLPNVFGKYFKANYSPHIYIFITASSASGKGVLTWAKFFGQTIHDKMLEEYKTEQSEYDEKLRLYNLLTNKQKASCEMPVKPYSKMFYIPGNSSSAALIDALLGNKSKGIIFETEADTISQTFKNEWGSYSDILRKAFHHETIGLNRKGSYIEIIFPYLAIVLSGTPEQVKNLMPNVENGLFSRFLYYAFKDNSDFKNPFVIDTTNDFYEFFSKQSEKTYNLFNKLDLRTNPIEFKLTKEQSDNFTDEFKKLLNKNRLLIGSDFNANVKRLGLITFRIAMTLSSLRLIGKDILPDEIICNDVDFITAMSLALALENHAIEVYKNFPQHNLEGKKLDFFNALPNQFNRQEYLKVADNLSIHHKTAEKYISQFKNSKLLNHEEHNNYTKTENRT